jgi:phospholipid transport system substrate-binding protein
MPTVSLDRRSFLRTAAFASLLALPAGFARAQEASGAVAPIQELNNGLLAVMKAGRSTPFNQRYQMLVPVVENAFDLLTVLRTSVGFAWSTLPPDQQQQLEQAFRQYTVATFVSNFDSYDGQQIQVVPNLRRVGAGEVVVPTQIVSPSSSPSQIDYVMRQTPSGWKAVDVLADGSISRVAVQRSDFRALVSQGNGTPLIASLQRKVSDLSGGALA